MPRTKRVRLTLSLFIGGEHVEKGSVLDLDQELANHLVAQRSAVQLNFFSRFFSRIRSFAKGRSKGRED